MTHPTPWSVCTRSGIDSILDATGAVVVSSHNTEALRDIVRIVNAHERLLSLATQLVAINRTAQMMATDLSGWINAFDELARADEPERHSPQPDVHP